MSAHAPSAHAPSAHAPSDHHPAGHHPAEPAGLDPDEPHTPYWLTALGGALFLAAAVFFLATAGDDANAAAPSGDSPSAERGAPEEPPSEE